MRKRENSFELLFNNCPNLNLLFLLEKIGFRPVIGEKYYFITYKNYSFEFSPFYEYTNDYVRYILKKDDSFIFFEGRWCVIEDENFINNIVNYLHDEFKYEIRKNKILKLLNEQMGRNRKI